MIEMIYLFEPVEDKPEYYWFSKRNYQIISKEVLEKAIKEYEDHNQLFLHDTSLQAMDDPNLYCFK